MGLLFLRLLIKSLNIRIEYQQESLSAKEAGNTGSNEIVVGEEGFEPPTPSV